jgi:hypothetical protein
MVFSTFLCRAFTAQYLYTLRCYHIPPNCFTAQLVLAPAPDALAIGHPCFLRHVVSKVAEPLPERKHPMPVLAKAARPVMGPTTGFHANERGGVAAR